MVFRAFCRAGIHAEHRVCRAEVQYSCQQRQQANHAPGTDDTHGAKGDQNDADNDA